MNEVAQKILYEEMIGMIANVIQRLLPWVEPLINSGQMTDKEARFKMWQLIEHEYSRLPKLHW